MKRFSKQQKLQELQKLQEELKEKNDLILSRQFVSRIYSQDLSRPIQNQIRQTARVVYDYLKRLDEVKW